MEKGRPKLRSGPEVAATIRREIIPKWRGRLITDIARRDVVKLLEDVVDDGRASVAHHLLAYLSKLFNWAIARDTYGLQASPITRGMAKDIIGAKKPRQRVLSVPEIGEVWQASAALPSPFGSFVRTLLVTGQRLREVANAKWSEFDLEAKMWTIPAARMKGDAAHEVPLSTLAIAIVASLAKPDERKPGAYIFSTTAASAPISGFSKPKTTLDRLVNEARAKADLGAEPIEPFVLHDCRRTMRTALSGLPVPDLVAELVIAHAKPGLHKVYDQHAYRDEKRRALDLWAGKLLSIVKGKDGGNVVRLETVRGVTWSRLNSRLGEKGRLSSRLEDTNPSSNFLEECWRAAVERNRLKVPIDKLRRGAFSRPSISGRDIAEALDFLSEAIGDEAFRTASLALRAYGIGSGGVKQDVLRLLREHRGDPEWIVMPMMGSWVIKRGLTPRKAAIRTAAQYGVPGPSFETVVKNLERTYRAWTRSVAATAPSRAPPDGDTGRKLKVRRIRPSVNGEALPVKDVIMGVAFDEDGFGVAPDTREWRRFIHEGIVALYGAIA